MKMSLPDRWGREQSNIWTPVVDLNFGIHKYLTCLQIKVKYQKLQSKCQKARNKTNQLYQLLADDLTLWKQLS